MIVCTSCGNQNEEGDDFCGSCGVFLEWSGERPEEPEMVAQPVASPEEAEPAAAEASGIVERVKSLVGIDDPSTGTDGVATVQTDEVAEAQVDAGPDAGTAIEAAARAALQEEAEARVAAREARARAQAEERARREATERANTERIAREEAEARAAEAARARAEAEEAALRDAQARAEAEERARARAEAEQSAREEAESQAAVALTAKRSAQARARRAKAAEARRAAQAEAEAKEEAERLASAEAESRAAAEADAREEVDRLAHAAAEAEAREETEREARRRAEKEAAAEAKAREREERKAREEAEARAKEEQAARQQEEEKRSKADEAARRAAAMVAKVRPVGPSPPPAPARRPIAPGKQPSKGAFASPQSVPPRPAGATDARPPAAPPVSRPATGQPAPQPPAARSPGAVQPAASRPRPAPSAPVPPSRAIEPGDLVCGQCGEGNTPSRKFCRRCGWSLLEAVVAPPLPLWRRLLPRRRKHVAAGERPHRKGGSSRAPATRARRTVGTVVRAVALLAALGLTIGVVGPWRSSLSSEAGDAIRTVRRAVRPQYDPVRPTKAEATSSLPGHGPQLAIDGISDSFWAEGARGDGEGQTLVLTFSGPVDLDRMGIIPGTSGKPEDFVAQPRPKQLHLVFSDGSASDVTLKDSAKFQTFSIKGRQVSSVQVHVVSVYPALSGNACAITEIEFFTKT